MSLTEVRIGEEVWLTCLTHALTTEAEEIMGLLFGDIKVTHTHTHTYSSALPPPCAFEQGRGDGGDMGGVAADEVRAEEGQGGDERTQASFQLMDQGFVGLIFSCFSEDAQKVGKIQVIAFQSLGGNQQPIVPVNPVINIDTSWSSLDTTSNPALIEGIEDTGDSKASRNSKVWAKSSDVDFYPHSDANHSATQQSNAIVAYDPNNAPETPVDLDGSDMTPSIQEALHRSTLDISDGKIHPLTSIHHVSTYNSSLCKLMEYCLSPAITVLQDRLKENELRLSMLMEEAKQLEAENQSMRNDSPHRLMYHGTSGSSSPMAQDKHASANQMSPRSPSGSSRRKAS
uniref:BRCC36 C-terminal helical domain-containing protein n=1 Tax=Leersia perrieri TaxID=77586 RepID=A0A0D9WJ96_9ORYZ